MINSLNREELVKGKIYKIEANDCCVRLTVPRAKFVGAILVDGDWTYEFDVLTIEPDWGSWTAEELTDAKT